MKNFLQFFMRNTEPKTLEERLTFARSQSTSALMVFTQAKDSLEDANEELRNVQADVSEEREIIQAQFDLEIARFNSLNNSLDKEKVVNEKLIKNINSILN